MSQLAQLEIVQRVKALLTATPRVLALADGLTENGRTRPMAEQHAARIDITWDESVPQRADTSAAPDDWTTLVRIDIQARNTDTATGEQVAGALAVAVYQRLGSDLGLGDLCLDGQPRGLLNASEEAGEDICHLKAAFEYTHRQAGNDLSA